MLWPVVEGRAVTGAAGGRCCLGCGVGAFHGSRPVAARGDGQCAAGVPLTRPRAGLSPVACLAGDAQHAPWGILGIFNLSTTTLCIDLFVHTSKQSNSDRGVHKLIVASVCLSSGFFSLKTMRELLGTE